MAIPNRLPDDGWKQKGQPKMARKPDDKKNVDDLKEDVKIVS